MKTQLLEDFDESGSAPSRAPPSHPAQAAAPAGQAAAQAVAQPVAQPAVQAAAPADAAPADTRPAAPPRPAVWQRPRQAEAAAAMPAASPVRTPAPAPAAAPAPAPAPAPAAQAARASAPPPPLQAPVHPRGFAPQPGASGTTTVPLGDTTAPAWPPGGDPDWLTERLARDAALQERSEWNGLWKRRLASWGAAGVLLALLAGGGLWLYEQSRVEGALVVVANTNPPPETHALPAGLPAPAAMSATPPAIPQSTAPAANVDTSAVAAAPAPAAAAAVPALAQGAPESAGVEAVGGTAGPSTAAGAGTVEGAAEAPAQTPAFADRTVVPVATDAAQASKPRHRRSRAIKHSETEARAEVREGERSYRQRYEETLMQCRAHGYDERQCLQRGCEMTRYGFACKG